MEYQFTTLQTPQQAKQTIIALLEQRKMKIIEETSRTMKATIRVGPGGVKTVLLGLTYIGLIYYFLNKKDESLEISVNPTGDETLVTLFPTGKKTAKISHFIKRTFEKREAPLVQKQQESTES